MTQEKRIIALLPDDIGMVCVLEKNIDVVKNLFSLVDFIIHKFTSFNRPLLESFAIF